MRENLLDRHGLLDTRGDSLWSRKAGTHGWISLTDLRDEARPDTLGRAVGGRIGFLNARPPRFPAPVAAFPD